MRFLTLREPGRVPVRVPVTTGVVLGRDPECEVVLGDRTVSRRHAQLSIEPEGVRLTDLGSKHGMLIEGERVRERLLRPGESIHLGSVLVEYSDAAAPAYDEEVTIYPAAEPRARNGDAASRLAILYEISRAVGSLGDPDELVGGLLDAILEACPCERGVVELHDGGAPRRIARVRGGDRGGDIIVGRSVVEALLGRRERVLVYAGQTALAASLVRQGVRAAMGVPLLSAEGPIGFIYVDDRTRGARFTVADLDFLSALAHLVAAFIDQAQERRRLESLVDAPAVELIGTSPPIERLRDEIRRYASTRDTAVLIRGESGSGKELVARLLHVESPRARGPFVAVNCAAIPDTMIESELFGYERGAFTGAVKPLRGKFALADGGTLFLDEVGDLSLNAQAKLLRTLESGEIQPLGADRIVSIDTRVVSATHKPLEAEIAAGRFREDLFYRLAVGEIRVPPLRDRGDDVVLLAERLLARLSGQLGRRVTGFSPAALDALRRAPWPGNVRQLRNEVERAVILAEGPIISRLSVAPAPARTLAEQPRVATLEEAERSHIELALLAHGGNILATATAIGVSRGLLYRKIVKYRIKT